jgi:hypothetical protein
LGGVKCQVSLEKKSETSSQPVSWVWWNEPVIPAVQAIDRRIKESGQPWVKTKDCLKNNLKKKGLEMWLKW